MVPVNTSELEDALDRQQQGCRWGTRNYYAGHCAFSVVPWQTTMAKLIYWRALVVGLYATRYIVQCLWICS